MLVGHYRLSDDANKLPENRHVDPVVKRKRQPKFTVHHVQAVIERMNEDSRSEVADNNVVTKGIPAKAKSSKNTAADRGVKPSVKKKRKLVSAGRSHKYSYSGTDNSEIEEDVEPDASPDDFINEVTTKLQIIASGQGIRDSVNRDGGGQTRKNKLSLKKSDAVSRNQECIDSRDGREAKSRGTTSWQNAGSSTKVDAVKQKPSTTMWSGPNLEDWDRIESLPDSDADEPFNLESKPSRPQAADDKLKSLDAETPKHRVDPSGTDKRKQTPVHQLVKLSSRPSKMMKYCVRDDLLDDSEEIAVEEYDSDASDEDFLSLAGSSPVPVAASEKGHSPSNKLRSSFWLTSPESKKSVYNTDDYDDDEEEFVSNSTSQQAFAVKQLLLHLRFLSIIQLLIVHYCVLL